MEDSFKTALFVTIMILGTWWIGAIGTILMYSFTPEAIKKSSIARFFVVVVATAMVLLTHEHDRMFYGCFTVAVTGWWALSEPIYRFLLHFEPITRTLSGLRHGETRSLESIESQKADYEDQNY